MRFISDYEALSFLKDCGWVEKNGLLYSSTDRCEEWARDEYAAASFLMLEYDYAWGGKKC